MSSDTFERLVWPMLMTFLVSLDSFRWYISNDIGYVVIRVLVYLRSFFLTLFFSICSLFIINCVILEFEKVKDNTCESKCHLWFFKLCYFSKYFLYYIVLSIYHHVVLPFFSLLLSNWKFLLSCIPFFPLVYKIHSCWLFMVGTLLLLGEIKWLLLSQSGADRIGVYFGNPIKLCLYFIEAKKKVEY